MLATPADAPPRAGQWLYEPKLDGVRALVHASGGRIRLFSPTRRLLNAAYPELVEALEAAVRGNAVLDGEIVAVRDEARARRSGVAAELYLFDCLFYEGIHLIGLPLVDRKAVLRDVVWYDGPIRFTPFRTSSPAAMSGEACAGGAEWTIVKRAESRYESARSAEWLEIRCLRRKELVVGGYTASGDASERPGALLLGHHENGALRYAGKVDAGHDHTMLDLLQRRLAPLHRRTSPFALGPAPADEVQWVTPRLVVEVGFGEWTPPGLLRRPRYLGLREDKTAAEVQAKG
jgi:DNA ligase D-like protein (predicted ligase)